MYSIVPSTWQIDYGNFLVKSYHILTGNHPRLHRPALPVCFQPHIVHAAGAVEEQHAGDRGKARHRLHAAYPHRHRRWRKKRGCKCNRLYV